MIVGARVVAPSTWTSGLVGTLFGEARTPGSGLRAGCVGFIVEAKKLEYQYPHALKVKYRGS